jgi:hypothetical protein
MRLKVSTANRQRSYNGTPQIVEGGVLRIDQDGPSPTIWLSPAFWQEITADDPEDALGQVPYVTADDPEYAGDGKDAYYGSPLTAYPSEDADDGKDAYNGHS